MKRTGNGWWYLGVVVFIVALPTLALAQLHLELMNVTRDPIPPDGSNWHELHPMFCAMHTQDAYEDNGDGVISACDNINLIDDTGALHGWHITWVGPTYYLVNVVNPEDFGYLEPTEPQGGGDPTCEWWVEIYPNFGVQWHIDAWDDNGNGVLDECDFVSLGGETYHVERIGLNILAEPGDPVSSEQKTWGQLKRDY